MEEKELELIRKISTEDKELKKLWDEHMEYERKLEDLDNKPYLTSEEEIEKRRIQKLKLAGKDMIAGILAKYRREKVQ